MARFRKVDVRVWGDEKFRRLSAPQPCGQSLWFYLLTAPETNSIPGLFRAGEAALAESLGWGLEAFREAFAEVSREGLAEMDKVARVVWVPNAIKYNAPESPNVVKSWRTHWDEIPESPLKLKAWHSLKAFMEGLSIGFREAFAKACPKPMANQEQEQEQEQEQDIQTATPLAPRVASVPLSVERPDARVADVVEHYRKRYPKRIAQASKPETRRLIRARLAEGYSVADLCSAIDGNANTEFYRDKGLTELRRVVENGEAVDKFMALAAVKPKQADPQVGYHPGSTEFGDGPQRL